MFLLETWISACCQFYSNISSFVRSKQSQITSLTVNINIIYLVFAKKKATIDCFLKYQPISFLFSIKIKLNINFWHFLLFA